MSSRLKFGWQNSNPTYSQGYLEPLVLSVLRSNRCKSVFDLGCGNGVFLRRLREEGFQAVGSEPDADGARIARRHTGEARIYDLGVGDSIECIEEKPFDAVVSTEVIEHLYDPIELFSFARGILTDRGILIISTPYHGYLKNLALSFANKWDFHHDPRRAGGHIKFWSKRSLTAAIDCSGFKTEAFFGAGRIRWLWKSMILVARKVA
jgi:2-polyprenyl-3-methyl-5-hydroxy-6-metoxy-1,4-benzoquinol methylase